jgi:hypothetical protein
MHFACDLDERGPNKGAATHHGAEAEEPQSAGSGTVVPAYDFGAVSRSIMLKAMSR